MPRRIPTLRQELTEPLLQELVTAHESGDFRNATACRCRVHPKLLTKWLRAGQTSDEPESLYARLFVEFGRIEGEKRAKYLGELEDTRSEESHFDDEGNTVSTTKRRTDGIRWLIERRYRQYRADYVAKPDEYDVTTMLSEEQAEALTAEAALAIAAAIARAMPPQLRPVFAGEGWTQLDADEQRAVDAIRKRKQKSDA